MGQSYNFSDKITIGLRYPGKTTVLGVASWMAEQAEDRREAIALIDRLFTDAKKTANFASGVPSWHLDLFRQNTIDEVVFIRWALNTALRIACQYGFNLHTEETGKTIIFYYEGPEGERRFSIQFILQ